MQFPSCVSCLAKHAISIRQSPPPSFAWVWHNRIPLLHRTCPRAKEVERSQALCHKTHAKLAKKCAERGPSSTPTGISTCPRMLKKALTRTQFQKSHKRSPVCTCPPDDCLCRWYKQDPLTPCLLQAYSSPCHNDSGSEGEPKSQLIAERYIVT